MKPRWENIFLFLPLVFCVYHVSAQEQSQSTNIFLNQETQQVIDEWNIKYAGKNFHGSFRPYLTSSLNEFHDTCVSYKHYTIKNLFLSKTFNEGPGKRNQYNFQILPIAELQSGYDMLLNKNVNELGGGMRIKLNINNDFTIEGTGFAANVSYPFYQDTVLQTQRLIPGIGMAYKGGNTYNYSLFTGYASYSPNEIFNFQAGNGKHFIGDGYRSMILSDVAANYPYFRINTSFENLQYSVWYTWMKDISMANGIKNNFTNKYSTMHYLSWNPVKELNLSLFENIIWQGSDTNRTRGFDVNYLNPIIFYRPQEFSVGSPDNAFIGLNISARLLNCIKLYGQLALDEFLLREIRARKGWWGNKQAWQLGIKYINAFRAKGFTLQAEYNSARPYTYSHGSVPQNYSHYGQPLAHPMGANFTEYLGIISYRKNRFMLSLQGVYAEVGRDTSGTNLGQNMFLSYTTRPAEYGHYIGQGDKAQILQCDVRLTYFILPQANLRAEIGYVQRSEKTKSKYELQNPFFYLSLKTSFWNFYRDY